MEKYLIEIFRAGTHTAMSGNEITFSELDLKMTACSYKEKLSPAPLVIGHPDNDGPAEGMAISLAEKGGSLYAFVEPTIRLIYLVRSGYYKKISSAFHSPSSPNNPVKGVFYLRHIGFLGAMTPSVKGMANPAFSEHSELDVRFEYFKNEHASQKGLVVPKGYIVDRSKLAIHEAAIRYQSTNASLSYADACSLAETFIN